MSRRPRLRPDPLQVPLGVESVMGAGVATGPHCPSSMARLPARRPAGRVVRDRAVARSIPLVGRERRRSAALSHPAFRIRKREPPSPSSGPVGRSGRSRFRRPGFSFRRPRGEPRLRFPGALPRVSRSRCAFRPPSIPRQAAVSREPAVRIRQACCRAGRVREWRPKPPLPPPLRKAWHPQRPKPPHPPPFSGTFEKRPKPSTVHPVRPLPRQAEACCGRRHLPGSRAMPRSRERLWATHTPRKSACLARPVRVDVVPACSLRCRTPGFRLAVRRRRSIAPSSRG
jgi:hypothetical protein